MTASRPPDGATGIWPPPAEACSTDDDLIDVNLRLPRALIERSLLAAQMPHTDRQQDRIALAEKILRGRRRRSRIFPGAHFGEPSWDMVLDIYISTHRDQRMDISSLCLAGGVSTTTALRHIGMLVRQGYLTREADRHDRRRTYVSMSQRLRDAVDEWLDLQSATLGRIA